MLKYPLLLNPIWMDRMYCYLSTKCRKWIYFFEISVPLKLFFLRQVLNRFYMIMGNILSKLNNLSCFRIFYYISEMVKDSGSRCISLVGIPQCGKLRRSETGIVFYFQMNPLPFVFFQLIYKYIFNLLTYYAIS
jgi:hypothetical protein